MGADGIGTLASFGHRCLAEQGSLGKKREPLTGESGEERAGVHACVFIHQSWCPAWQSADIEVAGQQVRAVRPAEGCSQDSSRSDPGAPNGCKDHSID